MPEDAAIDVKGLTYAYAGGRAALDDISFQVAGGENVGLVGPNGAGKTTLFLCLAGVLAIGAGRALLGGLDPESWLGREVRRKVEDVFLRLTGRSLEE